MKNENRLTLIDGVFTPQDAREVLLNVFSSKIRFHQAKNFSSKERNGVEDEFATQRITLLKQTIENIEAIISSSLQNNESLVIKSEITITSVAKKEG